MPFTSPYDRWLANEEPLVPFIRAADAELDSSRGFTVVCEDRLPIHESPEIGAEVFRTSWLPYTDANWERLSIFLNFLVPKLPAPQEEDLSKGILESIDMDSYRVEKHAAMQIQMPDQNAEIEPVPTSVGGHKAEPELDRLSNILKTFNDQFGNVPWTNADRVHKLITEEIPAKVAADTAYQNAKKQGDKSKARIEHDAALMRVMVGLLKDDTELFKQYSDNEGFKRWLADTVFGMTYEEEAA